MGAERREPMNCYKCKYCDDFYDRCACTHSEHYGMDVDDIDMCYEYEEAEDDDE